MSNGNGHGTADKAHRYRKHPCQESSSRVSTETDTAASVTPHVLPEVLRIANKTASEPFHKIASSDLAYIPVLSPCRQPSCSYTTLTTNDIGFQRLMTSKTGVIPSLAGG